MTDDSTSEGRKRAERMLDQPVTEHQRPGMLPASTLTAITKAFEEADKTGNLDSLHRELTAAGVPLSPRK